MECIYNIDIYNENNFVLENNCCEILQFSDSHDHRNVGIILKLLNVNAVAQVLTSMVSIIHLNERTY